MSFLHYIIKTCLNKFKVIMKLHGNFFHDIPPFLAITKIGAGKVKSVSVLSFLGISFEKKAYIKTGFLLLHCKKKV